MQEVFSVSNEVAAELATIGDGVLGALRDRLRCTIVLRGNRLTIEGDAPHVEQARAVVDELAELVAGGHDISPTTVDAVLSALEQTEDIREVFDDVVWRHRGKKIAPKTGTQKRYVDSIPNHTVTFGIGPAGTGKTYLAMALAVAALSNREVGRIILTRPAVEAGGGPGFLPGTALRTGGRAARIPAGNAAREGRSLSAPSVRRALRHARAGSADSPHGEGRDRGRAARVHAGTDVERLVHHPRRGAEHEPRADADVPDPSRLRVEGGRDRRRHPGRSAA